MTDLAFAAPQFAYALWVVLGITALLIYAELRSNSLLDRFVAKTMQARLVERPGDWRRGLRAWGSWGCWHKVARGRL